MKPIPTTLALGATLLALPCSAGLLPDGTFDVGEASWPTASGGDGTFTFDFPTDSGNPGAYGRIEASGPGFGIFISDGGEVTTLDSLGLTAGGTYTFSQDMIVEAGTSVGGLKVEFYTGGTLVPGSESTGDLFPDAIDGGASWQTYDFPISIPAAADGIKVVLLWGNDSTVGFDNIQVDPTPISQGAIKNNDFSLGSFAWSEIGTAGETSWDYPATGGNPGGYGVMTNSGVGFGIWIANNNQVITLDELGLSAGDTAIFQQDMIILSGGNVGGLKVDYFSGGNFVNSTGDMDPAIIGDGDTWETYSFPFVIPAEIDGIPIDGIKLVPLEGQASSVGYDNLRVTVQPAPLEATEGGELVEGTIVSWTPTNVDKLHQPQRSFDGIEWVDFGPAYPGTDTTSLLDPNPAPFYRISEENATGGSILVNGDFEIADLVDPSCAENWLCFSPSGQEPSLYTLDTFSGNHSIRLAVQNDETPTPNNSEIQQNLGNAGGFVTPGETYTLSFYAKQISSGVSYVQNYRIEWFDENGPISGSGFPFTPFSGGDGAWTQIVSPATTAPANATGALIQIFGATGAVPSVDAKGEVLLDNVELIPAGSGEATILETTQSEGIGIFAQTRNGQLYQAQVSDDLFIFDNISGVFEGNGEPVGAGTAVEGSKRFYRLLEVEAEEN